jgi:hypothetical protein
MNKEQESAEMQKVPHHSNAHRAQEVPTKTGLTATARKKSKFGRSPALNCLPTSGAWVPTVTPASAPICVMACRVRIQTIQILSKNSDPLNLSGAGRSSFLLAADSSSFSPRAENFQAVHRSWHHAKKAWQLNGKPRLRLRARSTDGLLRPFNGMERFLFRNCRLHVFSGPAIFGTACRCEPSAQNPTGEQ